jgi:hypothetical protein
MTYVPDMTERFSDAGEPEEEKEYLVSVAIPMTVEVRVSAVDEDEAKKEAKWHLDRADAKRLVTDYDLSEMEYDQIEQV